MTDERDEIEDWDDELDEYETITLTLSDGTERDFVISDMIEVDGVEYIVVFDEESLDDDNAGAFIFKKTGEENDEVIFAEIEDEEFEKVAKALQEKSDDYTIEY